MATKKAKTEDKKTIPEKEMKAIKKELVEYAQNKLDSNIEELVKDVDKKVIKEKNKVIRKKNFIILLLIILSGYCIYILYTIGAFDKYFNHTNEVKEEVAVVEDKKELTEEEKLQKQKDRYGYLLDSINIYSNSSYLESYYNGDFNDKLKLSLAFANVDKTKLIIEEDATVLKSADLKEAYENIFGATPFMNKSFDYNNTKINYIKISDIYFLDQAITEDTKITREITNISSNDNIIITTIEATILDGVVYNPKTNEELGTLLREETILKYEDNLPVLNYTFIKDGPNYILTNISVENNL